MHRMKVTKTDVLLSVISGCLELAAVIFIVHRKWAR